MLAVERGVRGVTKDVGKLRKIFVGLDVGIVHSCTANFIVESRCYECSLSPARGTNFDFCEFGAGFSSFQEGGISASPVLDAAM
jgi:hypothetical protein